MQEMQKTQVQTLGWENSLETKGQPTPVFLTGKSRGQRGLEDYSPWGHKELDTTEQLSMQIQIPPAISAKEGMGPCPAGWT